MEVSNPTNALLLGLVLLGDQGNIAEVRGSKTNEVIDAHFIINKPTNRCILLPYRHDNIFAKIAETLWVLAGRNDVGYLERYLPRAPQFSDDGQTWRAAYGARLRHYGQDYDCCAVDQVAQVIKLLSSDPTTRRAVMSIYDPCLDFVDSKDIPCNNWIQFLRREEVVVPKTASTPVTKLLTGLKSPVLHMLVTQRSSDIMWGFSGINLFEWSYLHEMMAYWTLSDVGPLHYTLGSLHLYERHWERAADILENDPGETVYDMGFDSPAFSTPWDNFDWLINSCMRLEHWMREGEDVIHDIEDIPDDLLRNSMKMLRMYNFWLERKAVMDEEYKAGNWLTGTDLGRLMQMLEWMEDCDFKIAAFEFFWRHYPNAAGMTAQGRVWDALSKFTAK